VTRCSGCHCFLNDIGVIFGLDLTGEFFIDRIFHSGKVRCQLWGIKTHDREILDRRNARLQWASAQLFLPATLHDGPDDARKFVCNRNRYDAGRLRASSACC
jgi:hypothetical protein